MSCEKVKLHLPSLCKPDKTCKRIGNPLSYYIRKLWESDKTNGNPEGNKD